MNIHIITLTDVCATIGLQVELLYNVKMSEDLFSEQFIVEVLLNRKKINSFNSYPFCLDAIKQLDVLKLHPSVTFLVGQNGSGKSTLLESIAISYGFNPEGGSKNFNFKTKSSHSELHKFLTLSQGIKKSKDGYFLRAESFYNVATEIDKLDETGFGPKIINSYGGKSLHNQSHGESFLSLLLNRFGGNGLYILDEPEAALSPSRQLAMLVRLNELVIKKSQFIIATHSPILMSYPNSIIYNLDANGITKIDYEDTEHFRLTKDYLNNYKGMLEKLFSTSD